MTYKEKYFLEIKDRFRKFGFHYTVAGFIAAQSCLEADFGRSRIYLENHNCFGMKLPHKRVSCAINENRSHAVYFNDHFSAVDYMLWLAYNKFPIEAMEDLDLFQRCLAKSQFNPYSDYISRINSIYQQFNPKNYDK